MHSMLGFKHSEQTKRRLSQLKKGIPTPWLVGRKMSDESREKNRIAHLGKPSPNKGKCNPSLRDTKKCLFCGKEFSFYKSCARKYCSRQCSSKATYNHPYKGNIPRGSRCWNWRGGVTPERKKLYFSNEYKTWRKSVFMRDGYRCVWCGKRGGVLNADHIIRWVDSPELRFLVDNGRTLCVECHRKTDTFGIKGVIRAKKLGPYPVPEAGNSE